MQEVVAKNGIKIKADGVIGPMTINSLTDVTNTQGFKKINNDIVAERIRYYKKLVLRDETQKVFLDGWTNRANSFKA